MTSPADGPARRAHAEGARAWPAVALPFDRFAAHLTAIGACEEQLVRHGAELYLAAACVAGNAAAISLFDSTYLAEVDRHVSRLRLTSAQLDDLTQLLRIRLLSGSNPKLAQYAGRAPLSGWLRIVAIRVGLNFVEAGTDPHIVPGDGPLVALVMADADPEWLASKQNVQAAFQAALEASFAELEPRQHLLLRMHFIDRLGLDEMARVFRVHRASVARWLAAARAQVFEGVRRHLDLPRAPTSSEFRSLVRLVKDDLHISVERALRVRA
jgi:RNA polymerase sigma-70 factor (ECF subfamily)